MGVLLGYMLAKPNGNDDQRFLIGLGEALAHYAVAACSAAIR